MDPQDGTEHQEPTANEVVRIQQTFSRVMQKVKTAYHKELQRKKQVDLTTSVDIMKARTNQEEVHDAEANEDDEAMQTMAKVLFHLFTSRRPSIHCSLLLRWILNKNVYKF